MRLCADPCGVVCVILIYGCIIYADYVVCIWMVMPIFSHSIWGAVHISIFNTLLFLSIYAHARTMLTDPGIVPINKDSRAKRIREHYSSSDEESLTDVETMILQRRGMKGDEWCTKCESIRPPRAHHCKVCRRCIQKMDHHCPWVNNCVGEYNQKYFLQFLLYVGLASLYSLTVLILSWVYDDPKASTGIHGPLGETAHHYKVLHSIFVSMESVLFGMFVLAVSCDQLNAIFTDETAVEFAQRRSRRQYAKARRRSRMDLLSDVCRSKPGLNWLLPCSTTPTPRDLLVYPSELNHFEV